MTKCRWLGAGVLMLCAATAHGLITAALPLDKIVSDCPYIVVAKVASFDPQKKRMILTVTEDLKGTAKFRKIPVILEGNAEGKKLHHPAKLMKRLAVDLPVVLFIKHDEKSKNCTTFAYTNGTWFSMYGRADGAEAGVWELLHGEPYLRRSFKGTTEQMRKLVSRNVGGMGGLPKVNDKEEPGFGPEISK